MDSPREIGFHYNWNWTQICKIPAKYSGGGTQALLCGNEFYKLISKSLTGKGGTEILAISIWELSYFLSNFLLYFPHSIDHKFNISNHL
jgi:hypothetical protein